MGNKGQESDKVQPQAAAVLSGGKTMTGTDRDTIEIDPFMRQRPGTTDPTKKGANKTSGPDGEKTSSSKTDSVR